LSAQEVELDFIDRPVFLVRTNANYLLNASLSNLLFTFLFHQGSKLLQVQVSFASLVVLLEQLIHNFREFFVKILCVEVHLEDHGVESDAIAPYDYLLQNNRKSYVRCFV
jgi:hypothetical protein